MTTLKKFEEGKTYYCRSACDHECIFTIKVVKRTAKTVTYMYHGQERRSNIKLDEHGNEYIKPDNYSMAPVFRAERQQEEPKKENFYFTFGSWEGYPFQSGYIIVKANDIREAARKFMAKYPNDRDETVVNCSDYYNEAQWGRILANGHYAGREPYEVME